MGEPVFSGIVEEMGKVAALQGNSRKLFLRLKAKTVSEDLKLGDSLAVNGTCLTVTAKNKETFGLEVVKETLNRTNLKELKVGDFVNLERALRLDSRLGGHLVNGHIDGVGQVLTKLKRGDNFLLKIKFPAGLKPYLIPQSSIAVEGVSLTIVEIQGDTFTVALIPHTLKVTTLGLKKPGSKVNLEVDLIGKYIHHQIKSQKSSSN